MTRYPNAVKTRILLRSLSIQGSWNYETLIGTGYTYTILPALRYLYAEDREALQGAIARHIGLFNSHPYFATVAIGAIGKLEADGAQPAVIERFKLALRGSLGSLGDRLVWSAWRPMAILLALVLLLGGALWWVGVMAFLVVYNALHLTIRVLGLRMGSRAGLELGRVLRDVPIQSLADRAAQFGSILAGIAIVLAARPVTTDLTLLGAAAAAAAFGWLLGTETRRGMLMILVVVTLFALVRGIAGNGA